MRFKKAIRSTFRLGLLLLLMTNALMAHADSKYLDIGISAFKQGDFTGAITAWEQAASEGDIVAMYNLGRIYSDKRVNKVNLARSIYWYEKSADAGNVGAQYNIGRILIEPDPKIQNVDRAIHYWKMAAENDYIPAMQGLASLYLVDGAPWYDKKESLHYLKMAANAGDKSSQDVLDGLIKKAQQQAAQKSEQPKSVKKEAVEVAKPKVAPSASKSPKQVAQPNTKDPSVERTEVAANRPPQNKTATRIKPNQSQNSNNASPSIEQQQDPAELTGQSIDMSLNFIERVDGSLPIATQGHQSQLDTVFTEAQQLARRGRIDEAIDLMHSLSLKGYERAYAEIAHYELISGRALSADALYYLSLGAQNGYKNAQIMLGDYLLKRPSERERNRGWYWLTQAYSKGDSTVLNRQMSLKN